MSGKSDTLHGVGFHEAVSGGGKKARPRMLLSERSKLRATFYPTLRSVTEYLVAIRGLQMNSPKGQDGALTFSWRSMRCRLTGLGGRERGKKHPRATKCWAFSNEER